MGKTKFNSLNIWKQNNFKELLCDPEFAEFFKWFETNITEENILTEAEIDTYNELKENGTFIDDLDEVEKELIKIGVNTSCNENRLEELQEELECLKENEEIYTDLIRSLCSTELKLDEEISQLKSKNQCLEINTQSLIENCKENAKILEDLDAKNLKSLITLKDSYTRPQTPPLLWCQLNLADYCLNCEKFALSLKIRAEDKLKLANFVDQSNDEPMKILYDLNNIKKQVFNKMLAKTTIECDASFLNHSIEVLSGLFEPMSYSKMIEQTERMSYRNEEIQENMEHLQATLNEKIEQFALQEAKFCELEGNQEKRKNAENRLEILKRIHKPMSDGLLVSEVMWILMQMEMEKTKRVFQNISVDRYKDENERCARNMEILRMVSERSPLDDRIAETFLIQFSNIITEFKSPESFFTNCIEEYNKATNNNVAQLRNMVSNRYQINVQTLINDFNSLSQRMNLFIGNGPSDKPNILNLSIVADMVLQKRTADFQKALLRNIRHRYMDEYIEPKKNDELWRRRQYFWIWFLTDQTKFLAEFKKTVDDLKRYKKFKPVNTVTDGAAGIRRQQ